MGFDDRHFGQLQQDAAFGEVVPDVLPGDQPGLQLEAADRQNYGALRITALEQLLETRGTPGAEGADAAAVRLWEAYASHARATANSHQLLAGDDTSWQEFAIRRRAAEPAEARAYLAYLARFARDPKTQQSAQVRLAADFCRIKITARGVARVWRLAG